MITRRLCESQRKMNSTIHSSFHILVIDSGVEQPPSSRGIIFFLFLCATLAQKLDLPKILSANVSAT